MDGDMDDLCTERSARRPIDHKRQRLTQKGKLGDISDLRFNRCCEASMERHMWTDTTRKKHARKGLRYSSDLTDAEWPVLEPVLPVPSRLGRPRGWALRDIMNGILYVLRTGSP